MNQIQPTKKYESPQQPQSKFSKTEIAGLQKFLVTGDHAVAKKSDLVELHKRTVAMFATLKEGLGDINKKQAAKDREAVVARLDEMEHSVNSMEGMLRIEMVPQLRAMVNDILDEVEPKRSRFWPRIGAFVVIGGVGLLLGAVYTTEITAFTAAVQADLSTYFKGN